MEQAASNARKKKQPGSRLLTECCTGCRCSPVQGMRHRRSERATYPLVEERREGTRQIASLYRLGWPPQTTSRQVNTPSWHPVYGASWALGPVKCWL